MLIGRMRHARVSVALALLCACKGGEGLAYLGLKISPLEQVTERRFPPGTPEPLYVNLRVYRSDDLLGSWVTNLDLAWADLIPDRETGKRTVYVAVPANGEKPYDYLLRVSSQVEAEGQLVADECAVVGFLKVAAAENKRVNISVHAGGCSPLICQSRADCLGQRYCLAFECYDQQDCSRCPAGAGCDTDGFCTGDCLDDSWCSGNFRCCRGVCSPHCPDW